MLFVYVLRHMPNSGKCAKYAKEFIFYSSFPEGFSIILLVTENYQVTIRLLSNLKVYEVEFQAKQSRVTRTHTLTTHFGDS